MSDAARRERYYSAPLKPRAIERNEAAIELRGLIDTGARERAISDVPVCTLLSGGIDSTAVAYFLAKYIPGLVAFTAVYDKRSRDLRCAREAAEAIGIPLIEVTIQTPTVDDLARVIRHIEMPFKAQVEIGWPCLKLAEAMRLHGFKVTFSGEGSDELWASYGFSYHALKTEDWHAYRKELFLSQARKNFPRCNKIFMAHGIECRLPFLHPPMLSRSIPQYEIMRKACFDLARQFVKPKTDIVDLGCSRGEAMAQLASEFGAQNRFIGVEVSKPMLEAARERFAGYINCGVAQILDLDLRKAYPPVRASATLAVLTIQFTPIEYRQHIIREIFNHTLPGWCPDPCRKDPRRNGRNRRTACQFLLRPEARKRLHSRANRPQTPVTRRGTRSGNCTLE